MASVIVAGTIARIEDSGSWRTVGNPYGGDMIVRSQTVDIDVELNVLGTSSSENLSFTHWIHGSDLRGRSVPPTLHPGLRCIFLLSDEPGLPLRAVFDVDGVSPCVPLVGGQRTGKVDIDTPEQLLERLAEMLLDYDALIEGRPKWHDELARAIWLANDLIGPEKTLRLSRNLLSSENTVLRCNTCLALSQVPYWFDPDCLESCIASAEVGPDPQRRLEERVKVTSEWIPYMHRLIDTTPWTTWLPRFSYMNQIDEVCEGLSLLSQHSDPVVRGKALDLMNNPDDLKMDCAAQN